MDYSEAGRNFALMYEVTGKYQDDSPLAPKIVSAASRREAMLSVMREMGASMHLLKEIDAESV